MKLSVSYIFLPAQEFAVRVAAPAEEMIRRDLPVWHDQGGKDGGQCGMRNKHRPRSKSHREVLQVEAV